MASFRSPLINLYSRDLSKALTFYKKLGFVEVFRTPDVGDPVHIEVLLDGFRLGIASIEAAERDHGLHPQGEGRWIELVVWTDDTDAAVSRLATEGATLLSPAHDFLEGALRAAWVTDPDGNHIQIVQKKS